MKEDQNDTGIERRLAEEQELTTAAMDWRSEVASRVDSYKTRRSRKRLAGEFSMKLDFNPRPAPPGPATVSRSGARPEARIGFFPPVVLNPPAEAAPTPRLAPEPSTATDKPEPTPIAAPEPELPPALPAKPWHKEEGWTILAPPRTAEAKLIEFPRASVLPPVDELAEEISDRPRILDTPDSQVPQPQPLAELSLITPDEEEIEPPPPALELPLQVASVPQRALTAICDTLLVAAACGVFGAVVHHMCPALPHGKTALAALAMTAVILWTAYYYLFYVYAGHTLGMKMVGLRLNTFQGTKLGRKDRRLRALMLVLSCASVGLGFAWALVDEDQLCWHDRISRTYLTQG